MDRIENFFFDTYALYEIISKNLNYEKYTQNVCVVTTKLNLMEMYYALLINGYSEEAINKIYDKLVNYAIEFSDQIIKEACKFRLSLKKRRLSYVDCIGYILARSMNIKFLTGDKEFNGLENVEHVV